MPPTAEQGDFTINFPLDINAYIADMAIIQQEVGFTSQASSLTLQATVHTTGQAAAGPSFDKTFVQSITTNLNTGVLTWTTALAQSDSGTIQAPKQVNTAARLLGLPVIIIRIASLCVLFIIAILLGLYFWVFRQKAGVALNQSMQSRQFNQKYKEFIVEVQEWPQRGIGENILTVNSLDELIKVSQAMLKPVNHVVSEGLDVYWLTDGNTRYEHRTTVTSQ